MRYGERKESKKEVKKIVCVTSSDIRSLSRPYPSHNAPTPPTVPAHTPPTVPAPTPPTVSAPPTV